ncbi:MAG: Na/Pi cotransporter family protein [Alphaproteobacteria bacterium]
MTPYILMVLGGIGLFLLGMVVLTEGLQALAGQSLRRLLARFTRSPVTGAAAGAATTAVIQSSSATTITAVGFVGAGLLSFPQALGIIFGANIGTTITGWLVAIFGFKLPLGELVLPLVFLGVLLRLFGGGRWRHIGWAATGFSLLFIGLDVMQSGMQPLEGQVTPEDFPDDTLFGRFQLLLIGIAITLITQSSSAGVATALVALGAGTISFPQAAALVIGMDVGTTATAALATLGGSTATRRTGFAHVIYNLLTGLMAFFLLGPYTVYVEPLISGSSAGDPQISLVAFHTIFNGIGVLLVLPFAGAFARLIVWLVPERGPRLTRRLDERTLRDPSAATDAAIGTLQDINQSLSAAIAGLLDPARRHDIDQQHLDAIDNAIDATRVFLERIKTAPDQGAAHSRHIAAMHALDHLDRLQRRSTQIEAVKVLATEPRLRRLSGILRSTIMMAPDMGPPLAEDRFNRLRTLFRAQRHSFRARMLSAASIQHIDTETALDRMDGARWLHRVAYHLWRISHHLHQVEHEMSLSPLVSEAALEAAED